MKSKKEKAKTEKSVAAAAHVDKSMEMANQIKNFNKVVSKKGK